MKPLEEIELYAWIGEEDSGSESGEIGLKQAICSAGMIPMVATSKAKMAQEYIVAQMRTQAIITGKTRRLCRFVFAGEVMEAKGGAQ